MCKWPVLHMVLLLMVTICTASLLWMLLLYLGCYFHKIYIHSCFSFRLCGFWKVFGYLLDLFKIHMIKRNIFWINFGVFGKNFVILRVSGQNIIRTCYLNSYAAYCIHTKYPLLCLPFQFLHIILFCALSSVNTSQELCLGTVVNWTLHNANLNFTKNYVVIYIRKSWNIWSFLNSQNAF